MGGIESRSVDAPDDVVGLPLMQARTVFLGEVHVGWVVHEPRVELVGAREAGRPYASITIGAFS